MDIRHRFAGVHTRLTDMVRHILGLPVICRWCSPWRFGFSTGAPVGIGTAVDMVGRRIPMMLISLGLQRFTRPDRLVPPLVTAVVMRAGGSRGGVGGRRLIGMSGLGLVEPCWRSRCRPQ